MEENNLNNKHKINTRKYTYFILKVMLTYSVASTLINWNKKPQEESTICNNNAVNNIKENEMNYINNKIEVARNLLKNYDQEAALRQKINLYSTEKLQIIEVKNTTSETYSYYIVGFVSNTEYYNKKEYLLIDMIELRPLYRLNENKEIIGENSDLSYRNLGVLFDHIMQFGYIKREYTKEELKTFLNVIKEDAQKNKNILRWQKKLDTRYIKINVQRDYQIKSSLCTFCQIKLSEILLT